jgi:hypothetical protein
MTVPIEVGKERLAVGRLDIEDGERLAADESDARIWVAPPLTRDQVGIRRRARLPAGEERLLPTRFDGVDAPAAFGITEGPFLGCQLVAHLAVAFAR